MSGFPASAADLTAAWFTGVLQARFPGSVVTDARLGQTIGGTAAKYRFDLTYALDTGAPPPSLWVKGGFETGGADQGDAFANEVRFYLDVAPGLPINLPACFHGELDPATRNGLIVLEDLGLKGVRFGSATTPLTPAEAAAVLDMQADYHARWWNDPALADVTWLKAGGAIAGSGMVGQYFAGFWEESQTLPRFRHITGVLRDKGQMEAALTAMIEDDAAHAHCLVHGDSHCANLYFEPCGRPGYLDWQHVMRGSWAFDLCNLVITGMTVEDRRANERSLLAGYRARLVARGVSPPSAEAMWRDYARHALWSFMWTMCPVSAHPETVCTLNSERACAAILDLASLEV